MQMWCPGKSRIGKRVLRKAIARPVSRHSRGFTLLELVLVCAIVAIVVGTVSASMAGFLSRSRLRCTAARLASMAVFARTQAITTGREVEMQVNRSTGEIALFEESEDPAQGFSSLGPRWSLRLPESLLLSTLEIGGEEVPEGGITFYPEGGAKEAHLVLSLRGAEGAGVPSSERKEVWVNKITGRVRVE